jgi:hypothetical protein
VGTEFAIFVSGPDGQPYRRVKKTLAWPRSAVRQTVAIALPRGVLIRGLVREEATGQPLAEARVDYWSKSFQAPRDAGSGQPEGVLYPAPCKTDAAGRFELVVPAEPGHLLVNGRAGDYAIRRIGIDAFGLKLPDQSPDWVQVPLGWKPGTKAYYYPDAWVALDPRAGERPLTVTLRRAPRLRGRIVKPDGQAAVNAKLFVGQEPFAEPSQGYWAPKHPEVAEGRLDLPVINPDAPLCAALLDAEAGLGAFMAFTKEQLGDEPVTVRLGPLGSAAARLRDGSGKPLTDYQPWLWLSVASTPYNSVQELERIAKRPRFANHDAIWVGHVDPPRYATGPKTDAQGHVVFPALIPGATYRLLFFNGQEKVFRAEAGKTVDLGDLTIPEPQNTPKPLAPEGQAPRPRKLNTDRNP